MRSLIRRLLFDWTLWRAKRKLYRACPGLREIDRKERAARKAHRATRPYEAERSRIMHQRLARELGRA